MTTPAASTFSLPRLLKRIALWTLAILVVLEGLLWAFFRAPTAPVYPLRLENHFPGLKSKVTLELDGRNLRRLDWPDGEKPAGAVRLLCIGGAATTGQLQNAPDTWWGQLKALLEKEHPDTPVQVAAHGTPGGLALWGAKWAATHVPDLKPDIIVINFGGGEALSQPFDYKYDPRRIDALPAMKVERAGWKDALLSVSQLARWKHARNRRHESLVTENIIGREDYFLDQFKKARDGYQSSHPVRLPFRLSTADPKNEYLDALKVFRNVAQAAGARLIITGEPCLLSYLLTEELSRLCCIPIPKENGSREAYRPDPEQIEQEMRRFQEAAKAFADENKLPFIEANDQVPRDPDHFVNELILTDKGAQALAALLLPEVSKAVKAK